jgi:hypothetical protein
VAIWKFFPSVARSRQEQLLAWDSFDNILGGLLFAEVTASIWEPYDGPELSGCRRAAYLLRVPPQLYDAFFNSPVGYRSQYARSPELGALANRNLVDALTTKLIACAPPAIDPALVSKSLIGADAKVWIDEKEVQFHFHDYAPEIDYEPWLHNSTDGVGLRAPVGSRLVAYGGWIDGTGRERLNPYKRTRSEDIHRTGFT